MNNIHNYQIKKSAANKACDFLVMSGWLIDKSDCSIKALIRAFSSGSANELGMTIHLLIDKGWIINSIKDIEVLDRARKIYRKEYLKRIVIPK